MTLIDCAFDDPTAITSGAPTQEPLLVTRNANTSDTVDCPALAATLVRVIVSEMVREGSHSVRVEAMADMRRVMVLERTGDTLHEDLFVFVADEEHGDYQFRQIFSQWAEDADFFLRDSVVSGTLDSLERLRQTLPSGTSELATLISIVGELRTIPLTERLKVCYSDEESLVGRFVQSVEELGLWQESDAELEVPLLQGEETLDLFLRAWNSVILLGWSLWARSDDKPVWIFDEDYWIERPTDPWDIGSMTWKDLSDAEQLTVAEKVVNTGRAPWSSMAVLLMATSTHSTPAVQSTIASAVQMLLSNVDD
jgi:hypothetical protein